MSVPFTFPALGRPPSRFQTIENLQAEVRRAIAAGDDALQLQVDALHLQVDAIAEGVLIVGEWSADSGAFPTTRSDGAAIQAGDKWEVTEGGTVDGVQFEPGDGLVALVGGGGATYADNWLRLENFGPTVLKNTEIAISPSTGWQPTLDWLAKRRISPDAVVTLRLAAGEYDVTHLSPFVVNHPDGARIRIIGAGRDETILNVRRNNVARIFGVETPGDLGLLDGLTVRGDGWASQGEWIIDGTGNGTFCFGVGTFSGCGKVYIGADVRIEQTYQGVLAQYPGTIFIAPGAIVRRSGDANLLARDGGAIIAPGVYLSEPGDTTAGENLGHQAIAEAGFCDVSGSFMWLNPENGGALAVQRGGELVCYEGAIGWSAPGVEAVGGGTAFRALNGSMIVSGTVVRDVDKLSLVVSQSFLEWTGGVLVDQRAENGAAVDVRESSVLKVGLTRSFLGTAETVGTDPRPSRIVRTAPRPFGRGNLIRTPHPTAADDIGGWVSSVTAVNEAPPGFSGWSLMVQTFNREFPTRAADANGRRFRATGWAKPTGTDTDGFGFVLRDAAAVFLDSSSSGPVGAGETDWFEFDVEWNITGPATNWSFSFSDMEAPWLIYDLRVEDITPATAVPPEDANDVFVDASATHNVGAFGEVNLVRPAEGVTLFGLAYTPVTDMRTEIRVAQEGFAVDGTVGLTGAEPRLNLTATGATAGQERAALKLLDGQLILEKRNAADGAIVPMGSVSFNATGALGHFWRVQGDEVGALDADQLFLRCNLALSAGHEVRVNGVRVLGAQQAGISDVAPGDADSLFRERFNAVLAALRAHGIIAG